MVEIKNTTLAGLVVVLLILGSGVTYVLKPTGNYRTCSSGWSLEQSGINEGKFSCSVRSGVYYDCSSVRDSSKTNGYYCDEATRVEVKTNEVVLTPSCPIMSCPKAQSVVYTDFGKYFCADIDACDTPVDIANKCQSATTLVGQ